MRIVHLIGGRRRSEMAAVHPDVWEIPTVIALAGERFVRQGDTNTFIYEGPNTDR